MNHSFLPLKVKYPLFISLSRFVFKIAACFFLFSQIIWAQYRFDSWDTEDGLPQNTVYGMTQTRDGYLWLTTYDGLVRFDGVRFTVFDKSNTRGITSNRFTSIYEDTEGVLWIGTEYGGLVRYSGGEFKTFDGSSGLPNNSLRQIQQDAEGNLVVSTEGGIVCRRGDRFEPCISGVPASDFRVYRGKSGAQWIFERKGLSKIKDGKATDYPVDWVGTTFDAMEFFEDRYGDLWIGTRDAALYRIADDGIIRYSPDEGERLEKGSVSINAVSIITGGDSDGNVWFNGGSNGEIVVFNPQTRSFQRFTTADGLSSSQIKSFFTDREGTLWIGTVNRGLNRVTKQSIRTFSDKDGLKGNNVYPILEDKAGGIWVGTNLAVSKIKDGVITNYESVKGVPLREAQTLYEDREGRLWIGFWGLIGYLKDGNFTNLTSLLGKFTYNSIHQDRTGCLWIGGDFGLIRFENEEVTRYSVADGLPHNEVKVIHEDRSGTLWLGTYGGLAQIKDGRFISFTERDGLVSNRVRTIAEDADGALWIGTYDGGISRFRDGKFVNYTTADGLFNNGAFRILEDSRGNFWISSNRGIYRVSRAELNDFADGKTSAVTSIAYGTEDGMLNAECNGGRQPAGVKTRDGRLWFPTQQGVVVVNPDSIPVNSSAPPVVIESVEIDNRNVSLAENQSAIRIEPGQSALEIAYTGLSLIKSEQVRFKYKLAGLSDEWIDAGTRRTAYYSYLPPGEYVFTVIAANSDGVWNTQGKSIAVSVIPPFYRTWWFISVSALGIFALALAGYSVRVSQLKREKRRQEAFSRRLMELQENERKRIAGELHDSLSQNLVIIKNRAMISLQQRERAEQAFEQLEEIADAAAESLSEVREIAHNLRPFQIDRLGLTKAIEALIRKANTPELSVTAELDEIDGIFAPEMEINLYRIIQESLNNIIKHAAASEANVKIAKSDKMIEITIRDDGRGFDAASMQAGESENGSGFGLVGITERARILGSIPVIESAAGKGTKIYLRVFI
jgi:signal transduction histidine kinase/ligand-binding sensor domain-containing protein